MRLIAESIGHTGKAVLLHFGAMRPEQVTVDDCRAYADGRKVAGRSVGTVWTELGHLGIVCRWAHKSGLIPRVPNIELPQKPAPKDRCLTEAEIHKLLTSMPSRMFARPSI